MKVSAGCTARGVLVLCSLLVVEGCSTRRPARTPGAQTTTRAMLSILDPTEAYRHAGFLAASGSVPFIGSVRFLAGPSSDSVMAVVAVSLPSRSLTFSREGERYRAAYEVEFDLLERAAGVVRPAGQFKAREVVRVSSLRETTRDEESVIFQQLVIVPPGNYAATLTIRDLGSNRTGTAEGSVVAPAFSIPSKGGTEARAVVSMLDGSTVVGLASPVTVHTVTPRASRSVMPDLVMSARSTAVFGRDSVIRLYFEWYGLGAVAPASRPPAVYFSVRSEDRQALHADSVTAGAWSADGQVAAATARVPVAKVGLGRRYITAWRAGGTDTVSTPFFVSPADDLAAVSFEELLGYLRYFATATRLRSLSDTAPDARAGAWAAFLRATDPSPATPEHEGLREYFGRLAVANTRFRGEGVPGWLSNRGMVYSTLGEPDRIIEPRAGGARQRGRTQVWEYTHHRLRLTFTEEDGVQRWSLTPSSEVEFQTVAERVRR